MPRISRYTSTMKTCISCTYTMLIPMAMLMAVPCVTLIAMFIMIAGGWTSAVFVVGVEPVVYVNQTVGAIVEKDLVTGMVKSVFFGVAICWVGVFRGFQVEGGAEGVIVHQVGRALTEYPLHGRIRHPRIGIMNHRLAPSHESGVGGDFT